MVGQVVAGAVAPVVVNSAKEETGLINQLFKIGILVGGLLIIGLVIAVVIYIFSLDLGGIFDGLTAPFRSVFKDVRNDDPTGRFALFFHALNDDPIMKRTHLHGAFLL